MNPTFPRRTSGPSPRPLCDHGPKPSPSPSNSAHEPGTSVGRSCAAPLGRSDTSTPGVRKWAHPAPRVLVRTSVKAVTSMPVLAAIIYWIRILRRPTDARLNAGMWESSRSASAPPGCSPFEGTCALPGSRTVTSAASWPASHRSTSTARRCCSPPRGLAGTPVRRAGPHVPLAQTLRGRGHTVAVPARLDHRRSTAQDRKLDRPRPASRVTVRALGPGLRLDPPGRTHPAAALRAVAVPTPPDRPVRGHRRHPRARRRPDHPGGPAS